MARFKPHRRLFGNKDVVHSYQGRRGKFAGPTQSSANHSDGLQHVEFAFAGLAKKDSRVDDRAVFEAIQLYLKGSSAEDSVETLVAELLALIESIRETRNNVSDREWDASLRGVAESVRNHSDLKPGEKGYLAFVRRYIS